MTDVAAWLVGLAGCTAPFFVWYLWRTLWGQMRADRDQWWPISPSMKLVISMSLLGFSFMLLVCAAVIAPTIQPLGLTTYLIWAAWAGIWLAELIALSAIGRVGPALCVCSLWTVYVIAVRFMV